MQAGFAPCDICELVNSAADHSQPRLLFERFTRGPIVMAQSLEPCTLQIAMEDFEFHIVAITFATPTFLIATRV